MCDQINIFHKKTSLKKDFLIKLAGKYMVHGMLEFK